MTESETIGELEAVADDTLHLTSYEIPELLLVKVKVGVVAPETTVSTPFLVIVPLLTSDPSNCH